MKRFGGILTRDGSPVARDRLHSLLSGMGRSETDADIYRDDGIVLVQAGGTVLRDAGTRRVLVGDIRIDDRQGPHGAGPVKASDEHLVLDTMYREPDRGAGSLLGAFSFAIWDAEARALTCVRDHFGVRPFYYADTGDFFAFASTLPALLGLIPSRELDEVRVAQYLELHPADENRTFYRAISRLPRAHVLTVSGTRRSLVPFWSPEELAGPYGSEPDRDAIEAFRDTLLDAVRCRVQDHRHVGSFLSGGLDSSSVTCVARRVLPENANLYTFSAVFPELDPPYRDLVDESRYIRMITDRPGFESAVVRGDQLTPLSGLERMLEIHGQPVDPPNAYLDFAMYELASSRPARIVLDGLEGDVTISHGVHYLDELANSGEWKGFFREVRGIQSRLGGRPAKIFAEYGLPHLLSRSAAGFAAQAPGLLLAGGPRMLARATVNRLRPRPGTGRPQRSLISARLAAASQWAERIEEGRVRSEQAAHLRYLEGPYIPSLLEFTHANANHFGLEARHPLFDIRLVGQAVRLRPDLKLRDGWNRYVLRAAMQDTVPEGVLWRPTKATLAPNFDLKMAKDGNEIVREVWKEADSRMAEYVDMGVLEDLRARNAHRRLWPALVLALYLNKFF